MLGYRLYFIGHDGHVTRALEIPVDSDDEALDIARQHRDDFDLELWTGPRRVALIPKKPPGEA